MKLQNKNRGSASTALSAAILRPLYVPSFIGTALGDKMQLADCTEVIKIAPTSPRKQKRNNHLIQIIMKKKITSFFRKTCNRLFRKKPHETIQGKGWILGDCSLFQHNAFTKE